MVEPFQPVAQPNRALMQERKIPPQLPVGAGSVSRLQSQAPERLSRNALIECVGDGDALPRVVDHDQRRCPDARVARHEGDLPLLQRGLDKGRLIAGDAEDQVVSQQIDGVDDAGRIQA